MLLIAISNGILREAIIKKWVDSQTAHQLSTITLLLLFAGYIAWVVRRFPPQDSAQAIWVGLIWLLLTLTFEFGFGRYRGNSWDVLLADYNILKGRLWVLIPLWVAVAPYLFYRLQR